MKSQNKVWAIILAIIITVVVIGGGVYWWQQGKVTKEKISKEMTETPIADKAFDNTQADSQSPKINNSQNINEKQENQQSNMITYTNKENGFSINYPKGWTYKEGKEFDYAFHVFFSKEDSHFGILPQGELDYGLPQSKPIEKKITINGKEAIRKDWKLSNGNILIIINFLDYPETWNENNRIDIAGSQNYIEEFEHMINSFKFVE